MKKEIIVCDKCHKEFEEETSVYATVFINADGLVNSRCDICGDCWNEIYNSTIKTEKGGVDNA